MRKALRSWIMLSACVISWPKLRVGKRTRKSFCRGVVAVLLGGIGMIDGYVKHKILTGDPRPYYLLADPIATANSVFLSYWSDYVTIVTDPIEIAELAKFEAVYGVGWMTVMPRGDTYVHVHRGISAVQNQWSNEKSQTTSPIAG